MSNSTPCADPGQRVSTSKVRAQFYQLTHDQAAFPMPWRGESDRLDRLSADEKLLATVVGRDAWKTGSDGKSRLLDEELGYLMGLRGPRDKVKRKVRALIYGRANRGKRIPGMVEKGIFVIHDDPDPYNPSRRAIEHTALWLDAGEDDPPDAARSAPDDGARRADRPRAARRLTARSAPANRAQRATPILGVEELEKSSSSEGPASAPEHDDDDSSLRSQRGDWEPDGRVAEALEAAGQALDPAAADEIRAAVPELAGQIRAAVPDLAVDLMWACVALAIFRAAEMGRKGIKTSSRGFVFTAAVRFAKSADGGPYDPLPDLEKARVKFSGPGGGRVPAGSSDDAKKVRSIRENFPGWGRPQLQAYFAQQGWPPERFYLALNELTGLRDMARD